MSSRSTVVVFFGRFVLLYGLLIAPWPGFTSAYGGYFRALGQMVLARAGGRISLRFEAVPTELHHVLDTRIALASPDQSNRESVYYLELDSRGVGWVPTALFLALVGATSISWRRRGRSLFGGLLLVHGYILFSIWIALANGAADLSVITYAPFWRRVISGMNETLINQMGASFVVPVLIWTLVVIRRRDIVGWQDGIERPESRVGTRRAGAND